MKRTILLALFWLFATHSGVAELIISVEPTKTVGNKLIFPLKLENSLDQPVESAKAQLFLLDKDGKIIADQSRWIIGGTDKRKPLAAGAEDKFHFVITTDREHVDYRLIVSRLVLAEGKLGNPLKQVKVVKNSNPVNTKTSK
jgi:hypothetical protein